MGKPRFDVIFFLLAISLLGLANFFNPEKPAVSQLEKRALEKRPEFSLEALFSGEYFRRFENYYSDTFIFREKIVKASRDLRQAFSLLGPGVSLIADPGELPDPPEGEEEPPAGDPGEQEEPQDNRPEPPKVDDGNDRNVGYWLIVEGQAVQLFKFNKEHFDYYAEILNRYAEKLGGQVKIYSLIAPSNSEFVQLRKYQGITDSQNEALDYLNSRLDPGIRTINAYDALNLHTDEYIYFRTDHHWTALGAYYAYCAFMEARGERPVPLERYRRIDLESFLGSSYSKTLDRSLEKNPDTVSVYMPFTEHEFTVYYGSEERESEVIDFQYAESKTDKYLVFLSTGGGTWSVIKTQVRNGKKILVLKDSFGNAFVPFLLPHYQEIYVVDSRFYSIGATGKNILQFIQDKAIGEVLFLHYMENVNWPQFMEGVLALMGQEKGAD
ncbi:MAG: hypothetical protein GX210_03325 [Firmicutes bacterium]|nr:hypothetical protein [Bacillota bacterium]